MSNSLVYGKTSRSYQKLDNSIWRDRLHQMRQTQEADPLTILLVNGGYLSAVELNEARDAAAALGKDLLPFLAYSGWLPHCELDRISILSELMKHGRVTEWMAMQALAKARQFNLTMENALYQQGWRN
ncbi:MAG: hypothetical protein K2W95_17025 [Candidatus Obscuribacterales bacterium]|nr:hypothetical protein [Candidatus Obscuribacterales bacterium]